MANDIIVLRDRCENAENELKAMATKIIVLCEKMISECNERATTFGEPKNEKAKSEMIDLCVKYVQEINLLSDAALEQINVIYLSVIKYNEFGSTPLYKQTGTYSRFDILTYSYFFSLAKEIGNVFEDLFEKYIPITLNDILNGLDIDNDGAALKISVIVTSTKKITNSVSKATKFYFNED